MTPRARERLVYLLALLFLLVGLPFILWLAARSLTP